MYRFCLAVLIFFLGNVPVLLAAPEPLQSFEHGGQVARLVVSPDGKILAVGGGNGQAKISLWHLGERELIGELTEHRAGITGLAFTPDSKQLVSCAWDGQVILWDLNILDEVRRFVGHDGGVTGLCISTDGRALATGGMDGTACLWDLASGKQRHRLGPFVQKNPKRDVVIAVAFSVDGKLLAAHQQEGGGYPTSAFLFDAETGKTISRLPGLSYDFAQQQFLDEQRAKGPARWVALRHRLAVRGMQLPEFNTTIHGAFDGFAPDGHTAAQLDSRRALLLEMVTNQDCFEYRHIDWITAVAFAPDGRHLVWAESDKGAVHYWSVPELVGAADAPEKQTRQGLEACWTDLAGDPRRAYRAGWVLAAAPADAVPFLRDKVLAQPAVDPKRIERLVADLDAPAFLARQKAADELATLGMPALRAVKAVLAGRPPLELTRRAERLVETLEEKLQGETVQRVRAVQTLERIGTAEARAVLEQVARGGLTLEEEAAAFAVRRLKK
jgi:WD40 repeat protein